MLIGASIVAVDADRVAVERKFDTEYFQRFHVTAHRVGQVRSPDGEAFRVPQISGLFKGK